MKTVEEILNKNNSTFYKLLNKAQTNNNLATVFYNIINADIAKYCRFANFDGTKLTIIVPNQAWATKIRYAIPDLIKTLRTQPEFNSITTIHYSIDNNKLTQNSSKNTQKKISHPNEIIWKETISDLKTKKNSTKLLKNQA